MNIVSTPSHVSVSLVHSPLRISIAEADETEPGVWWVARVRVPDEHQGSGVGSTLLAALLAECVKQGATAVTVAPGGYGADPARQRAFYRKAGFKARKGEGLMVWTPGQKSTTPL